MATKIPGKKLPARRGAPKPTGRSAISSTGKTPKTKLKRVLTSAEYLVVRTRDLPEPLAGARVLPVVCRYEQMPSLTDVIAYDPEDIDDTYPTDGKTLTHAGNVVLRAGRNKEAGTVVRSA